jgi:hypothetical protein
MMLENYNPVRVVTVIKDLHSKPDHRVHLQGCPHRSHNSIIACHGRETMGERCHNLESFGKPMAATFSSRQSRKIGSITFQCGCDNGTAGAENFID